MNLLAADIGGTKTLLGIFYWDGIYLKNIFQKHYFSYQWASIETMLDNFIESLPNEIELPTHGCIAVAGPVQNGFAKTTNLNWTLEEKQICASTGLKKIELINDFCVLLYGIPFLKNDQYFTIQTPINKTSADGVIAILGAGTGLGVARGIISSNKIIALPSEGGHKEFAPRTQDEWHLTNWLKSDLELQRLSVERIVSGTGLGHIARWLLQTSNTKNHPLRKISNDWRNQLPNYQDLPALASEAAQNGDPLMQQAVQIWLSAYGSVAGDLALQELCNAGLWICGGTASKHLKGLCSKTFLQALRSKGRFQPFIEELPVMALTDPNATLFSSACRALILAKPSEKIKLQGA